MDGLNADKLKSSALVGDADAMLALARAYHRGEGVERDVSEALDWYLEAAFSGSAEAMLAIAEMYRTGDGLPRDVAKSMEWYEKSGLDASANAVVDFADAYYSGGFGVPKDHAKAYELYRRAAKAGDVGAMAKKRMTLAGSGFVLVEAQKDVAGRDFYICDHPVTQDEYQRTMGANPSYFHGEDDPVEKVSWYDCIEYCNRRSRAEGLEECYSGSGDDVRCDFSKNGYRLPTESEWEWAARGGLDSRGYKYSGSDDIGEVAWYDGNSGKITYPVKQKKGNELVIYDMSGNVWEWCWDWYDETGIKPPCGPASGSRRIGRGGSWRSSVDCCSVSYRYYWYPSFTNNNLGFRLACSAKD